MGVLFPLFLFIGCLSAVRGSLVVLDLSNVDTTSINVSKSVNFQLIKDIFVPRKGILIQRIIDGAATAWSSSEGELCSMVSLSTRDGYSSLLHIVIERDTNHINSFYYRKSKNVWSPIDESSYQEQFKEMSLQKVVLDVRNLDVSFVNVRKDEGLLDTLEVKVLDGHSVEKVVDGDKEVWNAKVGERCSSLFIPYSALKNPSKNLPSGDFATLIYFTGLRADPLHFPEDVKVPSERTFNLYFEKVDGKWKNTSVFNYHSRRTVLKSEAKLLLEKERMAPSPSHSLHSSFITHFIDINKVDERDIDLMEVMERGVLHRIFTISKPRHVFNAVYDGKHILWISEDKDEFCKAVWTYSKNGKTVLLDMFVTLHGYSTPKYFEKRADTWYSVDEEDFEYALAGFQEKNVKLDLRNIDKSTMNIKETQIQHVVKMVVSAKSNHYVTSVVDDSTTIWTASSEDDFVLISLYTLEGIPRLLDVFSKKPSFKHDYFVHKDYGWVKVEENEFESILESLRVQNVQVNISDLDTSKLTVIDIKVHGVRGIQCTPKSGYRITDIFERDLVLWRGATDQESTGILVYYKKGRPFLADVVIADPMGYQFKFLEKNREWEPIEKSYYNYRFETLRVVDIFVDLTEMDDSKLVKVEEPVNDADLVSDSMEEVEFGAHPSTLRRVVYTPKDGYEILGIKDAGDEVWKAEDKEDCASITMYRKGYPLLMELLISNSVGHYSRYFCIRSGKWTTIDQVDYNSELELLKTVNVTLDISNLNHKAIDVYEDKISGVPYFECKPKPGYRFISVASGLNTLWKAILGQQCTHASVHYDGTNIALVNLLIMDCRNNDKGNMYYRVNDGQWIWIGKGEYDEVLNGLKKVKVTLDLSNPNENQVDAHKYVGPGYLVVQYTPKKCSSIVAVTDGEEDVWTAKTEEECTGVRVTYKDDVADTLILRVQGKSTLSVLFFKRVDNHWTSSTVSETLKVFGNDAMTKILDGFSTSMNDVQDDHNGQNDDQNGPQKNDDHYGEHSDEHVTTGDVHSVPLVSSDQILDVSNVTSTVYNGKSTKVTTYLPKPMVKKVVDDNSLIWEVTKGTISNVLLYQKRDGSHYVLIHTTDDGRKNCNYFVHLSHDWVEVDMERFYTYLGARIITYTSLDVCGVDVPSEDLIETIDAHPFGYPSIIYNAQPDVRITSVFCGNTPMWSSSGPDYCLSASMLDNGGKYALVEMFVKDTETKRHHYEYYGGKWNEVDGNKFGQKTQVTVDSFHLPSILAIFAITLAVSQL